jgi:deoxycytidylate deaminase
MTSSERTAPEIVLGFVAPSGSSYDSARDALAKRLAEHDYDLESIRLSDYLMGRAVKNKRMSATETYPPEVRIAKLQAEGDRFRADHKAADALAFVAVNEIVLARARRSAAAEDPPFSPAPAVAYMVWSLKRPEEVATLRAIYGQRFFLLSVYSSPESREDRLARQFATAHDHVGSPTAAHRTDAAKLIAADEEEKDDSDFGQNVRETYPIADFFVDATTKASFRDSLRRAIDIIFADPFATPTRDEFAMSVAHAASLRSAELGRQVGAVLATPAGDIVATGVNEVPSAAGGQYWEGDKRDDREFRREADSSDTIRARMAGQIADGLLAARIIRKPRPNMRESIIGVLRQTRVRDVTEFGRAVHAESSAIIDAARRGVSIAGTTLFVTTFPCHQCTRNVIASGVKRIVYVFPYPKSLADELHGDAVQTKGLDNLDKDRIPLMPFLGVAPRQYDRAFTARLRKGQDGKAVAQEDSHRPPDLFEGDPGGRWNANTYIVREQNALKQMASLFS